MSRRVLLLPTLLLACVPPARAEAPLARLAEEMAAEVVRVARDRPVEVAPSSGAAATAGATDWRALLVARLAERTRLAQEGPRVRVEWALGESPARLTASARLLEEPGDRLLDIVSVSAPLPEGEVPLLPGPLPAPRGAADIVATSRSAPIDARLLALAWLSDDRALAVSAEEAAVYRLSDTNLSLESRRRLPGPFSPVRSPAALAVGAEATAWVLTSGAASAALLACDGPRLLVRSSAQALPFAGSPEGLRFRAGTSLVEGSPAGLGPGPFVALEASGAAAVAGQGELLLPGATGPVSAGLRVGSALARLWDGLLACSSPQAPGDTDSLWLVEVSGQLGSVADAIPVEGCLSALASRRTPGGARLLAALLEPGGRSRLLLMDLRRREP